MRDRKQIREAIEGVTAETGGWDAPVTWMQIADVLVALLAPAQAGGEAGELAADIQANHGAEIAPDADALRERAIEAVQAGCGHYDRVIAAVERALRDAYLRGRADAATPREEPAPAGVLAVVEAHPYTDREGMRSLMHVAVDGALPERVTVAVLTGPLAGIVEAHRALTAYLDHAKVSKHCGCAWPVWAGTPSPAAACAEGQRLAAAINK